MKSSPCWLNVKSLPFSAFPILRPSGIKTKRQGGCWGGPQRQWWQSVNRIAHCPLSHGAANQLITSRRVSHMPQVGPRDPSFIGNNWDVERLMLYCSSQKQAVAQGSINMVQILKLAFQHAQIVTMLGFQKNSLFGVECFKQVCLDPIWETQR